MATALLTGKRNFLSLVTAAHAAGMHAATAHTPTAMVVNQHANLLDDTSPVKESWVVPSGICGFAGVRIRPGTSAFARWMLATGKARKAYSGGIETSIMDFGQSYEKKLAYAGAFADTLRAAGINAYVWDRVD